MTKFSIATALLLGSVVFASAADNLASAFKDGKLNGQIRAQYFHTDWDLDNKYSASGFALGGSLIYKTDPLYGFSFGTGFYTTQNPGGWTSVEDGMTAATSKDLFSRDSTRSITGAKVSDPYGKGYTALAEAYLEYDVANTKARGGRILMSNPWIMPNDTKMIPIAVEGVDIISNDLPNTSIQIDYANRIKERGMSYFGNMADTGDVPDKIAAYYTTHYGSAEGIHGDAPGVYIAGIKNKSINNVELEGWEMHWPNLIDQIRLEANYALEAGDMILGFGGVYMNQIDEGAGNIILPHINNHDTDNCVDTYLYALRASADYRAGKLIVSTSHTDSGGDILSPWRGFPTQGYTRSMTQTDWTADTRSYKGEFDYDFNAFIPGVSTMLSYSFYDRNPSKKPYQSLTDRSFQNGDTRQLNFDVICKLSGIWHGTKLKARFMDQNNDTTAAYMEDTSNKEMRLEAIYQF